MLQAQSYDPNGEYVAYWVPELQSLPKEKRNFPGQSYIKPIVALKYGNKNMIRDRGNYAPKFLFLKLD